jgi:hypothetical protein
MRHQDGSHPNLNNLGQLTNLSTSNVTTEQHTPQIHAQPQGQIVPTHHTSQQQPPYEDFYSAQPSTSGTGGEFSEVGQSEHYIYVTYPPELKRRLLERYGKDVYMLLRKDMYDY